MNQRFTFYFRNFFHLKKINYFLIYFQGWLFLNLDTVEHNHPQSTHKDTCLTSQNIVKIQNADMTYMEE